jgi:ribulose-phosphate 3-epimerase
MTTSNDRVRLLLSASLMCARLAELGPEVRRLDAAGVDSLHVDIMDGHFVPNLALNLDFVRAIRPMTRKPIHVHLMTEDPESYLDGAADAGVDLLFFHLEATTMPLRLAAQIEARGIGAGIALNPSTPLPDLPELLSVPNLLVMAVEPGFAGGSRIRSTPARVAALRERGYSGSITVDGSIDEETIPPLWHAGANAFVCGSSGLFTSDEADYLERTNALRATITAPARPIHAGVS